MYICPPDFKKRNQKVRPMIRLERSPCVCFPFGQCDNTRVEIAGNPTRVHTQALILT